MSALSPIVLAVIDNIYNGNDRVSQHAAGLGRSHIDKCFASYQGRLTAKESLTHGDFHVFNIMVGQNQI